MTSKALNSLTAVTSLAANDLLYAAASGNSRKITVANLLTNLPSGYIATAANDGGSLGISGTAWSDLFLASGGVIDFATSDVTVTHSPGLLTIAGAGVASLSISTGGTLSLPLANAGIEIGAMGSANTPFIDFHSGATIVDYDARLMVFGGTGVSGGGFLSIQSETTQITGVLRIEQTPTAIGTGTKTISNAADSSTNLGHYLSINLGDTVYYIPCGAVALT